MTLQKFQENFLNDLTKTEGLIIILGKRFNKLKYTANACVIFCSLHREIESI